MLRRLSITLVFALWACSPGGENPGDAVEVPPAQEPAASASVPQSVDAPADDRPVVVFLGTSLTAGLGLLRDDETYVARVAELASAADRPIRAVNAGVSGETSAGGLRRVDWVLREPLDVLVLELGANDGLRGQDPTALAENLRTIIRVTRTRYPGTPVILAGMEAPPNLGADYTGRFRDTFVEVSSSEGTTLIPFLLEGVAGVPDLNQADGIHPTAEGHRLVAQTVWPYLESTLEDLEVTRAERNPS